MIHRKRPSRVAPAVAAPADWRFLLPGRPAGRLLWEGPDDRPVPLELAGSMHVRLARRSGLASPADGVDVVAVVASPGRFGRTRATWRPAGLERITRRLRGGGLLYLEVDRPGALVRPGSLARRLEALGYTDIGLYWPVRGFERPDLYLALDDRRPQRHYLNRLLWRGSLARRLVRLGLLAAVRLDGLRLVAPRYVVVARRQPLPGDEPGVAPGMLGAILAAWPALTGADAAPRRVSWLVQPSATTGDGKLMCHAWRDDDPAPSAVFKVARTPEGNARIEAENWALHDIRTHATHPSIRAPRPLGSRVLDGRAVAAETSVDGRPLTAYLAEHPGSVSSMASRWEPWVDWLADLHVRSSHLASAADLDALLFDPMAHAPAELALEPGEAVALSRLRNDAKALLERHPLRIGLAHHDLGPSNVLVADDGRPAAVIDWEVAGSGLPGTDLQYFIGRLSDAITEAHGPVDGWTFKSLFLAPGRGLATTPGGMTARRWLERYCARLDLSPAWLPTLAVATWTMHARNERRKASPGVDLVGPFRHRLKATLHAFEQDVDRRSWAVDGPPVGGVPSRSVGDVR